MSGNIQVIHLMRYAYLHHDGHLSDLTEELLGRLTIDRVLENGGQLSTVRGVSFSAFGWEDLSSLGPLVAERDLAFRENNALVSNCELVLSAGSGPFVAIQKGLGANFSQSMVKKTGLSILAEKSVERLDMRVDGLLKGGICGAIGRGVSKQVLSAELIELMIPFLIRALLLLGVLRRHFGGS